LVVRGIYEIGKQMGVNELIFSFQSIRAYILLD